ncbi:hypothetical protein [Caballeronia sp. SBC2]|uniref:hypothetical protein n=1 Tax=Caballeronia sp. SBC2 TaxID=2705547 RepID=UPI0013EB29FF|nr:hypothetical protein [Caballeronia sp. SBC2]
MREKPRRADALEIRVNFRTIWQNQKKGPKNGPYIAHQKSCANLMLLMHCQIAANFARFQISSELGEVDKEQQWRGKNNARQAKRLPQSAGRPYSPPTAVWLVREAARLVC